MNLCSLIWVVLGSPPAPFFALFIEKFIQFVVGLPDGLHLLLCHFLLLSVLYKSSEQHKQQKSPSCYRSNRGEGREKCGCIESKKCRTDQVADIGGGSHNKANPCDRSDIPDRFRLVLLLYFQKIIQCRAKILFRDVQRSFHWYNLIFYYRTFISQCTYGYCLLRLQRIYRTIVSSVSSRSIGMS